MNKTLAISARTVPYAPLLRPLAGSVMAVVLLQQMDYWFARSDGGSFWKFLEPCDHGCYKSGDSWTEEIGFSKDEFRTAFDKIGIRYRSKTGFNRAKQEGKQFDREGSPVYYASYHDKKSGLTHYIRNHSFLDAAIDDLISGNTVNRESQSTVKQKSPPIEIDNRDLRKSVNPISISGDTQYQCNNRLLQESTQESTKDNSATAAAEPQYLDQADCVDQPWISHKGAKIAGNRLILFKQFWDAFNYKNGRAKAIDAWINIKWCREPAANQALFDQIIKGAVFEAAQRQAKLSSNVTPIYPEGWLAARRWEDEVPDLAAAATTRQSKNALLTAAVMDIHNTDWC